MCFVVLRFCVVVVWVVFILRILCKLRMLFSCFVVVCVVVEIEGSGSGLVIKVFL